MMSIPRVSPVISEASAAGVIPPPFLTGQVKTSDFTTDDCVLENSRNTGVIYMIAKSA